jgi:hypothetical protein
LSKFFSLLTFKQFFVLCSILSTFQSSHSFYDPSRGISHGLSDKHVGCVKRERERRDISAQSMSLYFFSFSNFSKKFGQSILYMRLALRDCARESAIVREWERTSWGETQTFRGKEGRGNTWWGYPVHILLSVLEPLADRSLLYTVHCSQCVKLHRWKCRKHSLRRERGNKWSTTTKHNEHTHISFKGDRCVRTDSTHAWLLLQNKYPFMIMHTQQSEMQYMRFTR